MRASQIWNEPQAADPFTSADGESSGAGAVSGISGATAGSPGSSDGIGTPTGIGAAFFLGDGSSAGLGTPESLGVAIWNTLGSSSGIASDASVSGLTWAVLAEVTGVAVIDGQGEDSAGGAAAFEPRYFKWPRDAGKRTRFGIFRP